MPYPLYSPVPMRRYRTNGTQGVVSNMYDLDNSDDSDNIIVSSAHLDPRLTPDIEFEIAETDQDVPCSNLTSSNDQPEPTPTPAPSSTIEPSESASSQQEKWNFDKKSDWSRTASSESATSVALSSNTSSVILELKQPSHESVASPISRKRLLDGSIKLPSLPVAVSAIPVDETSASGGDNISPPTTEANVPSAKKSRSKSLKQAVTSTAGRLRRASAISGFLPSEVRPRSSIPSRLPVNVFANQCLEAAYASRLDPFALHSGEHELLADLILDKEVTVYLNIRNAILRVWRQNPLCSVTPEEAAGCAKESRFYGLAEVAYKWLVRNGYINFGCAEVLHDQKAANKPSKSSPQKTVVVIGAGISGLSAARQLESLFSQSSEKWTEKDERPPRVIVLEARKRIGGRVYSKPFRDQQSSTISGGLRNTAEMGAMIVTGFEHGNPLDIVIRGQLGLRYHLMTDALTIYDCDGKAIDEERDMMNTELYTDISDRAGEFRVTPRLQITLHGDEDLIKRFRDPAASGSENFTLEPLFDPLNPDKKPSYRRGRRRNAPPGTEKLTGRSQVIEERGAVEAAARTAKEMGWRLRDGISKTQSLSLHEVATATEHPTLGTVMDDAIKQYQQLIQMRPRDMRLLNWHHANLEYANAAPISSLSLSGHDQDTGNEFEGAHSEIVGGYTQLPRGLMNLPTKLDVRFEHIVDSIHYQQGEHGDAEGRNPTKIVCTNGEVIVADQVVVTTPLGVLKSTAVDFDPPLPPWKRGAISRMGFGLLNKVILLYDTPFWDNSRDMFGLLNDPEVDGSLDPIAYARKRGRFYLIWNASKTSGRPVLVALMAGHAAHEVETTDTTTLLSEVNARLRKVFTSVEIPPPREVIVTRWRRDPFTRGTYSFVGPETRPGDYDVMAKPVGNLHFAGEATCGTHPATVHGAFLSGLRVASEVMEAMAGPIQVPNPLVKAAVPTTPMTAKSSQTTPRIPTYVSSLNLSQTPRSLSNSMALPRAGLSDKFAMNSVPSAFEKVKTVPLEDPSIKPPGPYTVSVVPVAPRKSVCAGDSSFWVSSTVHDTSNLDHEAAVMGTILSQIGERPIKPNRPGVNPFLVFTKAKWEECKAHCNAQTGGSAGRDLIRATIGKWWKAAQAEDKQSYVQQSQAAQESADTARKTWEIQVAQWDRDANRIRAEYSSKNPTTSHGGKTVGHDIGVSRRKTNVSNNVVLDHV